MLYFLMFSLCSGGFFCLMLSQTPHAKTMLGRPVKHPARLRLAGVTLFAAALAAANRIDRLAQLLWDAPPSETLAQIRQDLTRFADETFAG